MISNDSQIATKALTKEDKKALLEKVLKKRMLKAQQSFPMSKGQESLWYVNQSDPTTAAYNVASTVTIHSVVDYSLLERAVNTCIQRHSSLSTSYGLEGGKSKQYIQTDVSIKLILNDVAGFTENEIKDKIESDYKKPFDLSKSPIIRASIYHLSETECIFMLVVHHIGFDASSLWTVMEDMGGIYQALEKKRSISLVPVAASYRDFTQHQANFLASNEAEKNKNYWLKKLSGELSPLTLDISSPRPAVQSYKGKSKFFELPKSLSQKINELAKKQGVTAYTVLLAAYYTLLYRHSNQKDICVVSPTSGRNQSQFMKTVGYFVNPVIMRAELSNNPIFIDFINSVNETVLEGIAHQEYPFSSLIEALNPARDSSYSPLSQVSFVFQKTSDEGFSNAWIPGQKGPIIDWAGLQISQYPLNQQEGQFELELEIVDVQGAFHGILKYNTDLFEEDKIKMLIGNFTTLLTSIAANPKTDIARLNIMTELEIEQQQVWNKTSETYPAADSLHQLFERQVDKNPSAIALTFANINLSYQQLNARSNQLAHYLLEQGVQLESKVAICMDRSIEMVVSLLAVIKAGGVYVPVDPNYPAARVEFLLQDTNSKLLLSQQHLLEQLPVVDANIISLDQLDLSAYADVNPNIAVTKENLAYMIYTSGSTGNPKGTMNTHAGISNRLLWMQAEYMLGSDDSILQKTPFSFDVSVWEFFWPLISGARLVVAIPEGHKDTDYLINTIQQEAISVMHFVPSMLSVFLSHPDTSKCSSLKRVICSGEALSFELQQRFFNCLPRELHNLYGPTEAAIDVTYWKCNQGYRSNIVPIGKPIANIEIFVLDEFMQQVPVGVNGELHISGIGLARGYYNRQELTKEKFIANPYSDDMNSRLYKTGDLVRFLADGNIEYLQRIDNQIKLRGFRIELGEVEAMISRAPGINETVVVMRKGATGDEYLVAYVTLTDKNLSAAEILGYSKEVLPAHCVPSAIVILKEIPLTPNGKINHKGLPEHSFNLQGQNEVVPPRTPLERQLLTLWKELLALDNISITDNFFSLGGHSLLAVRLMASIESQLGQKLPLSALIQSPTIKSLAKLIDSDSVDNWKSLVPIQEKGNKTPFFFIPGGGGNVLYFYALAEQLGKQQPFFGMQAQGLDGLTPALESVAEIAEKTIKEIKTVQAEGPYIIGGHCVGALVAHEICQQLIAGGDAIEKLFVLDAPAPCSFEKKDMVLENHQWICILINTIEQMLNRELLIDTEHLRCSSNEQQLRILKQKLAEANIVPENAPVTQIKGLLEVFKSNASLHYTPPSKLYPLNIVLLRAEEINEHYDYSCHDDNDCISNSTLGWGRYGDVETCMVDGNHITMLSANHSNQLAERINQTLLNSEHTNAS